MAVWKVIIATSVLVAFVAFYNRPLFPDTASNHTLKTTVGLCFKFVHFVSVVGGLLGFSPLNITRSMMGAMAMKGLNRDSIESYKTHMDGVEVMVFKPVGQSEGLRPGIVHYHGGGWALLSPDEYSGYIEELTFQSQAVVVSVNYRLAPEHLYPIPLEDCLTATMYFLKNAGNFGVDKHKIGVKGDSAGGNLAMAAALKLSTEADLPSLKFMSLDYPALQAFDFTLPCYQIYGDGPGILTKRTMILYWLLYAFGNLDYFDLFSDNSHTRELEDSAYAGFVNKTFLPADIRESVHDAPNERLKVDNKYPPKPIPEEIIKIVTDPLYAPLMASDKELGRLPPTYMFIVEFDVLRDDGLIAARRLENAGVKVTQRFMETEEHGYLSHVAMDPTVITEINRFAKFFNQTLGISE